MILRRYLVGVLLLMAVVAAHAQPKRASETFYIAARTGLTLYQGDNDNNPRSRLFGTYLLERRDSLVAYEGYFYNTSWAVGAEVGYQFHPDLAVGVAYHLGAYPELRDGPLATNVIIQEPYNEGSLVHEVQARIRYLVAAHRTVSPFVTLGVSFAVSTPANRAFRDLSLGYAPLVGLGLDWQLRPRLALVLEADARFFFPDDALDAANPGANPLFPSVAGTYDDADYDLLSFLGIGLRYTFRDPRTPVDAVLEGPTVLRTNQPGTFTARVNDDATGPCTFFWEWEDGVRETGLQTTRAFPQPGVYTVRFTATCAVNTDIETHTVAVVEPPAEPPVLADCQALPVVADIGAPVRIDATLSGTPPFTLLVDFGDGQTADALPVTHTYSLPGAYTVRITATNAAGTVACSVNVVVEDRFCAEVTELNTVYFDFDQATLTPEARGRLDENVAVLKRCPVNVRINGYTDDVERRPVELAQERADAVRAYYIRQGIPPERLRAQGIGRAPDANNKEDPGPGDRNGRRADSIPTDEPFDVP